MDYSAKYNELRNISSLSFEIAANDFERCIILLRTLGLSYGQIQSQLGNPSKKIIRSVLLQYAPNLIDNCTVKTSKYSEVYSKIYGLLKKENKTIWRIFGEDVELCIKDQKVYFDGDLLENWSDVEQHQILNEMISNN